MSKYRVIGTPGVAAHATLLGDHGVGAQFTANLTDAEEQALIGAGVIVLEGGSDESSKPKAAKESGSSKAKR